MSRKGKVVDLSAALGLSGFGGKPRELPPADPPASALIEVDLEAIQPYDLNPRRTENPDFFARLVESIFVQGLDNPIPVTRRPGEAHYRVAAGGNTRLKALKRLHEQHPEDERFAKVPCIFRRYISEIDLIAAHLRENDLRDPLTFIDHAHAIVALKRRLEEDPESGGRLSDVAFEKRLQRMGHRVSRRDINRMEYAVAWLDEAIPVALRHGLGPRLIDLIGRLHKFYGMVWDDLDPEVRGSTAFDPLFLNALNAHDGETLPIDLIKDSLNQRVQEVTGIPAHRVKAQVEALMEVAGRGDRTSDRISTAPAIPSTGRVVPPPGEPAHVSGEESHPGEGSPIGDPATPESPEMAGSCGDAPEVPPGPEVPTYGIPDREKRSDGPPFESPPGSRDADGEESGGEAVAPPARITAPGDETAAREAARPGGTPDECPGERPVPASPAAKPARNAVPLQPSARPEGSTAGPAIDTYLNPDFESGRDHRPRPDDLESLRSRAIVLATRVAQAAGLQDLVQPDREAPAGFSVQDLAAGASARETVLWHLLNALSASHGFDFVPPSEHVRVHDPAAFAGRFLFRFDDGRPPPDSLLRLLFLLVEAIVAVARAAAETNSEHS